MKWMWAVAVIVALFASRTPAGEIVRKKKAAAKKAGTKTPRRVVRLSTGETSPEAAEEAYRRLSYDGLFGRCSKRIAPKPERRAS